MSVYLIYFEKKQLPSDGDFSRFSDVNNYSLPRTLHNEEVVVEHLGKKIKAHIIFDGISSGDFYFFGKNREGKKGEFYRDELNKFILSRLENKCVDSFVYLNIFDGDNVTDIKLPDLYIEIPLMKLESIFKSNTYKGLFNIV